MMSYPAARPQRPQQNKSYLLPIILIACAALVLLLAVAVGGAFILMQGRGAAAGGSKSYSPAVADALTLDQLQTLCSNDRKPNSSTRVPSDIDDAIVLLSGRDKAASHTFDLQRRVAAEYLYGSEVDSSKRDNVSRTIAEAYQLNFGSNKEKTILLKAFGRWGTSENLPQLYAKELGDYQKGLVKGYKGFGKDVQLEQLITASTDSATVDIAPWLAGLLSSSVGKRAEELLEKIGPDAAEFLITVHDSDDREANARTTRLFESYGVNETQLRINHYQSLAKTDHVWNRGTAYSKIAAVPFEKKYQDQIVDLLIRHDTSERLARDEWLKAVLVWGDERCLSPVITLLQSGHHWDAKDSLPFITKIGDAKSIDALVTLLVAEHYFSDRAAVAEALISVCKKNPEADLQSRVHEPVLRSVHDLNTRSADEIWRVLRATNFDSKLLIEQTLNDLGSSDPTRKRSAWETISKTDVDESLRSRVADKLATLLSDETSVNKQQRVCFVRWADSGHPLLMKWMQKSYVSDDEFQDVMPVVANGPVSQELLSLVADNLADRRRQREMYDILMTKCKDPNGIAVGLLESSNPVVLQAACAVLGAKGTSEHLPALAALNSKAKKARVTPVIVASKDAGEKIRTRSSGPNVK